MKKHFSAEAKSASRENSRSFSCQTAPNSRSGKLSKSLSVENYGPADGKSKSTEVKNSGKVLINSMGFCVGFQWIFPAFFLFY